MEATVQEILKNPDLLTHRQAPNEVLHAWDGLCGAVSTELKDLLITSPNASVVYALPLGVNWEMAMYRNYHYADDDPDTYRPLYGLPNRVHFEELDGSSLILGPGLWAKQELDKLKMCCKLLLDVAGGSDLPVTPILIEQRRLLPMFLERLEALPLTFERLRLCVAETQRLAPELRAYLDYYLLYRPRMNSPNAVPPSAPKFDLAGAFTTSTTVAQELFKAGIPVWLLRSLSVLPATQIDRAVEVMPCTEVVDLQACPLHLREIHMITFYRTQSILVDARSSSATSCSTETTTRDGTSISAFRGRRGQRGSKARTLPTRFEVAAHAYLPPIIPSWQAGLLAVNADPSRSDAPAAGYAFPKPELFVSVKTLEKQKVSFRIRHPANHDPALRQVNDREAKRWEQVSIFLAGCQGEMTLRQDKPAKAKWRDIDVDHLSQDDIQAILWELSELNFRLELLALDARMCGIPSDDEVQRMAHSRHLGLCFPTHKLDLCWIVDPGSANHGLGDPVWVNRAPYMCALQRVIASWVHPPPDITRERETYDPEQLEQLELAVTKYYCDTFFLKFGWAPIVPRHLEHPLQTGWEPQPRDTMLGKHSGVYADVTAWEDLAELAGEV
ncbi:hypothetical protein EV421DRAFT_1902184 [Armillaria borealis]|uniref:Uncharacterized protein n=1 Tax=Armillaria borealis TaxID=47425 RepID=A0AA39MTP0_9AGAR|nr:hypothetical protein EV421DRAFT_1902184 [Armillaria borealis]